MQSPLTRTPLLIALLATLLTLPSLAADANGYYEDGLKRYRQGARQEAMIQLRNALQQDNSHLPSRILLGQLLLESDRPGEAEQELLLARDQQADRALLDPLLARSYLQQGEHRKLVENIDPWKHGPETARELFVMRANALLMLGERTSAQWMFQEALQLAPDDAQALLGLARIHLHQGDREKASSLLSHVLGTDTGSAQGWLVLGQLRLEQGELEAALAALDRSLELDTGLAAARLHRVALLIDLGRAEQSAADLKQLQEQLPFEPMVSYLQALVHRHGGRREQSAAAMRRAHELLHSVDDEVLVQHAPSLLLAGELALQMGRLDSARMYFNTYLEDHPQDKGVRKRLASVMLSRNEPNSALDLLRPTLESVPQDHQVLTLMGRANLELADYGEAVQWFRQASVLAPEDKQLPLLLAHSELLTQNPEDAAAALETLTTPDGGNTDATLLLVRLRLQSGKVAAARTLLSELLAHQGDNPDALNLLGITYVADRQLEIARTSFEQVLEQHPGNLTALLNLVRLDISKGAFAQAVARLHGLPPLRARQPVVLSTRALLEERRGDWEAALALRRQAWEQDRRALQSGLGLVYAQLRAGRPKQALQAAESLQTVHPRDLTVLEAVGRSELAAGRAELAQLSFRRMTTLASYNSRQLLRIARLQLQAGDLRSAYWSLYKAVEANPDDPGGQLLAGSVELLLDKAEEAGERAATLLSTQPERYEGHLLEGEIALHKGDPDAAVEAFQRAHQLQASPVTVTRLQHALRLAGMSEAATELLQDWVKEQPQDMLNRRFLASALIRAGRHREALEHYRLLLQDSPDDPQLLNDLALLRLATGSPLALEPAQRAHDLAPQDPRLADTLGWILVSVGEAERGLSYLREAQSRLSQDPEIRFHIAGALAAMGRNQDAERELSDVLASDEDFAERSEAESLLEKIRRQAPNR